MLRPLSIVALGFGLFGCAATAEREAPAGATAAIVNGTPSDDGSVVALLDASSGELCTGTLIHPRVILTAKHCVQDEGAEAPRAPERFIVATGPSVMMIRDIVPVLAAGSTRGPWTRGALAGDDVGVLILARSLDGPTREVRREPATDLVGTEVTVVGYGLTPMGTNGRKYEAQTTILDVADRVIVTGPSICHGDSGGPMLSADGRIVGIASIGTDVCGSGVRGFNTLDTHLELVDAAIRFATCGPDRECGTDDDPPPDAAAPPPDPTAPPPPPSEASDPGELGAPCDAPEDCLSGLCADTGADGRLCVTTMPDEVTRRERSGGCSTAGGLPFGGPIQTTGLFVLAAWVLRRRRSRDTL